jgi:phenylalanyl-tRNA synthetase beta chain
MDLSIEYANKLLGTDLTAKQIILSLEKQRISAKPKNAKTIECQIPKYRADFMHPADLVEEVALGFGYNNFKPKSPSVFTKGALLGQTKLVDRIADLMAGAGFLQVNTPILTNGRISKSANSQAKLIKINNPVSEEYENVRCELLPHLIQTLSKNTHNPYPQKIFEIGFIAIGDDAQEVRAKNELHVAGSIAHSYANLSELSGVILELLKNLKIHTAIRRSELKMFIPGRSAILAMEISGKQAELGVMGEIHPSVLENFKLEVPVSAFELNLEFFGK